MTWLQIRLFLLTLLVFILLIPLVALAQASQPASAPAVASWFKLYWPWILGAISVIVPAVITLLRKHPESAGATRTASWLEIFMELITIVCPQGSKSLMKLPFTRAKVHPLKMKRPAGAGVLAGLLVLFMLTTSSCCLFKPGTCKSAYGNCAAEKIKAEFPDVLTTVEAALSGSTPAIVMNSLKLLEGLGVGLIVCAVQTAKDKQAATTQPSSGPVKQMVNPRAMKIIQNADSYLKMKGVQ